MHTVDVYEQMLAEGKVWFGKNGDGAPSEIRYLSEVEGVVPWTWWPYDECGTNAEARKEGSGLFGPGFKFPTPKPEKLLHRIISIASNPGDLVVDPFAGSGTTAAVAMKMGRRFFTSELSEETFRDYVVERLRKVGGSFIYGRVQTTDIVDTNDFDHEFA